MKTSRHKKVRKNLGFYINNYKFHQPFQILIDGTFAFAALQVSIHICILNFPCFRVNCYLFITFGFMHYYFSQNKFNIHEQLAKYFKFEVKLLTTPCIVSETEKLGLFSLAVNGAMQIVKQYAIHKCAHAKKTITGSKCLKSMIGKDNTSRYDRSQCLYIYIYI